jgi:alkylation response protein AidB-like acyl-CoA dehydrogenase
MITEPVTTADHLEIRDAVRDFTTTTFTSEKNRETRSSSEGFDSTAWKQMVELGWTALVAPESLGGDGLGAEVQCVLLRELGARLAPTPYLASVAFAATVVGRFAETNSHAKELSRALSAGSKRCAVIFGSPGGWPADAISTITAVQHSEQWVLQGRADLVLDGSTADTLIVTARCADTGWGVFSVSRDAPGVAATQVTAVDRTRSWGEVRLDGAVATALHEEPLDDAAISALVNQVAVYLSAEMVGAATACMNQTLDYLRDRRQFGRPIGTFQALKHRCADLAVAVTTAQEFVFAAAATIDNRDETALALLAPMVLARTGEVFERVAAEAIQLHGGVGFTDEVDIGLYYKRAISDIELLAAPADAYARMDVVRQSWTR